jgi:hypothetical protein
MSEMLHWVSVFVTKEMLILDLKSNFSDFVLELLCLLSNIVLEITDLFCLQNIDSPDSVDFD